MEIVAVPVILDCDPGTDDALAIFLALGSPELSVLAVTVAGGNVGLAHTLRNACALVRLAGADVPVYAGADRPLLGAFVSETRVHGENGLGGVVLPPGATEATGLASDVIRRILREAAEPVTLIGIGPATNLALALTTEPAVAANVAQIVLMSGAWAEGNVTPAAEFNAWSDPEALAGRVRDARVDRAGTDDTGPHRRMANPWFRGLLKGGVRNSGDGSAFDPACWRALA
jgi:purine nucleosidase